MAVATSLFACGGSPRLGPKPATLGRGEIDALPASVFEIVLEKWENPAIVYDGEPPRHLLPAAVRDDKYVPICTAFAIAPDRFASAEHCFSLSTPLHDNRRWLRDRAGQVHPIATFSRYSQRRDLVEFTLASLPAGVVPLRPGAPPAVGDTVYTVGTALAEGIAVRSGDVASFTPEEVRGEWQFIRFSAPASPGNSGGPLLDTRGHVIGVVVRKTESENLNFATPIAELANAPTDRAEMLLRLGEHESGKSTRRDTEAPTAPLPATIDELVHAPGLAYLTAQAEVRAEFEREHAATIFPTAPDLPAALAVADVDYYLGVIDRGSSGRWEATTPTYKEFDVDEDQRMWVTTAFEKHVALVIAKPAALSLLEFVRSPRQFLDAIFRGLVINASFGDAKVRILSLGDPATVRTWSDALGRPWTIARWRHSQFHDMLLACTPVPVGVACVDMEGVTPKVDDAEAYFELNVRRYTLSYEGPLDAWREFLALPPDLRPAVLADAVLAEPASGLRLHGAAFDFHLGAPPLGELPYLYVDVEYASLVPLAQRVMGVRLSMGGGDKHEYYATFRDAPPPAGADEDAVAYWEELRAGKAPYDGSIEQVDDGARTRVVRERAGVITQAYCFGSTKAAVPAKDLAARCRQLADASSYK